MADGGFELTKLTADLAIHQKLEDEPNDVGGLSAEEMKAKFDQAGLVIQDYLNEKLVPEVEGELEKAVKQAKEYADQRTDAARGGDMSSSVYDTQGLKRDIFRYAHEAARETLGDGAKFGYVCVGASSTKQYGAGSRVATLDSRTDLRGLWDEEKEGWVMPEGAKAVCVTVMQRWARESFASCKVALLKNGAELSAATGPDTNDGNYVSDGILLAGEVKGGDLVQIELSVTSSGGSNGAVYAKFMKSEIIL